MTSGVWRIQAVATLGLAGGNEFGLGWGQVARQTISASALPLMVYLPS